LELGLSQEKLALEVGLDRTYITSVENGKRNISIQNLEKIWTLFELTPSQFFDSELFRNAIHEAQ
jgi:transcriptional regulator with XRE-family HTH domain